MYTRKNNTNVWTCIRIVIIIIITSCPYNVSLCSIGIGHWTSSFASSLWPIFYNVKCGTLGDSWLPYMRSVDECDHTSCVWEAVVNVVNVKKSWWVSFSRETHNCYAECWDSWWGVFHEDVRLRFASCLRGHKPVNVNVKRKDLFFIDKKPLLDY